MSSLQKLLAPNVAKPFSDVYSERPIWAIVSVTTSGIGMIVTMGQNPYVPIGVETIGSPVYNSKARPSSDELTNAGYYWAYSTTTQVTTQGWTPNSGYWGISNFGQTACTNNFDAFSNGVWGFYNGNVSHDNLTYGGVVIGDSNFCQSFDFFNYNLSIGVDPIGGGFTYFADNASVDYKTTLTNLTGWQQAANSVTNNLGMLSYNRQSNKVAILVPVSTSGYLYRLHLISLGSTKVGASTTNAQLYALLQTAMASNGGYKYYDITFPADCVNPATNVESNQMMKIVLCDDDTVWFTRCDNAEGTTTYLRLYSISSALAAQGTTPTVTARGSLTTSARYGYAQGAAYGIRHMMSDDNSRCAIYIQHYYYCGGMQMFVVNTASAANTTDWLSFTSAITTGGHSIAPIGGKRFAFIRSSNNTDSTGVGLYYLDTTILGGLNKGLSTLTQYHYPTISSSTAYGSAMCIKVQPLKDSK